MDISRNLPSLLVKGRNVCRVEGGMSCERVSTLVALCMWRLWTWKRRLGVPHRVLHASVNSHARQLAAPRSCPLVTSIDETGSLTCPLSLLKIETSGHLQNLNALFACQLTSSCRCTSSPRCESRLLDFKNESSMKLAEQLCCMHCWTPTHPHTTHTSIRSEEKDSHTDVTPHLVT